MKIVKEHIKRLGGDSHKKIGYIGECHAMLGLAERGIFCQKLYDVFDFDLLTSNGLRIEVKTSNLFHHRDNRRKGYIRDCWQFNNAELKSIGDHKGRKRKCDFYIFICMHKNILKKIYISPEKYISNRRMITIPVKMKKKTEKGLHEYEDRWDLIEDMEKIK